jgi:hypothetical protein
MKHIIITIIFIILIIAIISALYLVITRNNDKSYKKNSTENFEIGQSGITSICTVDMPDYANPNICYDISYIDPVNSNVIQVKAKIDNKYYIDASGMLEIVPYGYVSSPNKLSYIPKTKVSVYEQEINNIIDASINKIQSLMLANPPPTKEKSDQYKNEIAKLQEQKISNSESKTSNSEYNSDNFDITYHAEPIIASDDESTAGPGKMWIKDKDGKLIAVPYADVSNTTLYYQTGSYPFGPSSYVPNYEESVFLSKLSNLPTTSEVFDTVSQKSGFCDATKSSKYEREQKCNQISLDSCASTSCCVLLGGEKCVAGDINGPSIKANYSDFLITNKDYYYFDGNCYGNCS